MYIKEIQISNFRNFKEALYDDRPDIERRS